MQACIYPNACPLNKGYRSGEPRVRRTCSSSTEANCHEPQDLTTFTLVFQLVELCWSRTRYPGPWLADNFPSKSLFFYFFFFFWGTGNNNNLSRVILLPWHDVGLLVWLEPSLRSTIYLYFWVDQERIPAVGVTRTDHRFYSSLLLCLPEHI